jgi:hypothetical protein
LLTSRAPRPENGPGPSQNPADVAWRRKNKKPAGRLASKQQQQQNKNAAILLMTHPENPDRKISAKFCFIYTFFF